MPFKIALLGPIPKGDEERKNWLDWKIKYKKHLAKVGDVEFSDGDAWRDETKPTLLVGHDLSLIKESDLVIVNAESKIGAGTAQEILVAKYFKKPVVTILPKESHHRKTKVTFDGKLIDDWIHPFIFTSSDYIAETVEQAINWIKRYQLNPNSKEIKDISLIDKVIDEYQKYKTYDYSKQNHSNFF